MTEDQRLRAASADLDIVTGENVCRHRPTAVGGIHEVARQERRSRSPVTGRSRLGARYVSCYVELPMQKSRGATAPAPQPSNDIVFACTHCATSFVVDAAAAGLAIQCQSCGKPTRVPKQSTPPVEVTAEQAARISDVEHRLKENASQRTEITGYINQLSIQLHRWQLRLKDLNERKAKLDAELATLTGSSGT